jgi:hypothetical protein
VGPDIGMRTLPVLAKLLAFIWCSVLVLLALTHPMFSTLEVSWWELRLVCPRPAAPFD